MVTDHQHVEMLIDGIDGKRTRGVGRRRQNMWLANRPQNIRGVPAACAFGVKGVDTAVFKGI